ncbi:MAG: hypothetical protein QY326_09225 [Bdellovibrionota bacterium]|nr:MAG: hypothetical protein QY326_09225 [Bdellovibrionota bacterium]
MVVRKALVPVSTRRRSVNLIFKFTFLFAITISTAAGPGHALDRNGGGAGWPPPTLPWKPQLGDGLGEWESPGSQCQRCIANAKRKKNECRLAADIEKENCDQEAWDYADDVFARCLNQGSPPDVCLGLWYEALWDLNVCAYQYAQALEGCEERFDRDLMACMPICQFEIPAGVENGESEGGVPF